MNFIGDFFALGLVTVLGVFFVDRKYALDTGSKFFVACLLWTACNAVLDLITGRLMLLSHTPLWLNMLVNSAYFLVNIFVTSSIALYLFNKILEHSHDQHCMRNARIGLCVCLAVYLCAILANLWTGWMFYFDENNAYCRGPLNALGYVITVCQMGLVIICYVRNRKNAGNAMRRVLIQIFPVVVLCIVVQRVFPEIMLNSFIMVMVETVLFLSFQGPRQGIHALTRLNDRHRFFRAIEDRIAAGTMFQVFLINIKNYSVINQKYGHVFGDEVLYQFAFSLERLIKNSEAFHMNGTVFALILPYGSRQSREKNLDMLLEYMESGIDCGQERVYTDYIVVEYIADAGEQSAEEFYEKLEYAASVGYKQKNHLIRYTEELGGQMKRRRYLIERMQNIDREHGFQVWYQPIYCMASGRFCSMEALIRLREADGTLVSPSEFIPLAEETGMIQGVTWFVMEEVCAFLQRHPDLNVCVGVNLPMNQLLDKSFGVRMDSLVQQYGVSREKICLEFTERAILENFQQVQQVMLQFTAQGYRFYLDDFGAGYSNFNCLLQLPFQVIKLDSKLVEMDLRQSQKDEQGLVKKLTEFLHGRNLPVVVEGIERQEDVERLRVMGVDRVQGYVFAKPMPEADVSDFYEKRTEEKN